MTIVGFYLLTCVSIGIFLLAIIEYQNSQDRGAGDLGAIAFLGIGLVIILVCLLPSIIAVILIFLKIHRGFDAAIIAMFFLSFVVMYTGIGFLYEAIIGDLQIELTAGGIFRVVSPVFMVMHVISAVFLWKGRKAFKA